MWLIRCYGNIKLITHWNRSTKKVLHATGDLFPSLSSLVPDIGISSLSFSCLLNVTIWKCCIPHSTVDLHVTLYKMSFPGYYVFPSFWWPKFFMVTINFTIQGRQKATFQKVSLEKCLSKQCIIMNNRKIICSYHFLAEGKRHTKKYHIKWSTA